MNVAGLRSDPPYLPAHPTRVAMVMARMTILSSVEAAMVLLVKGHAGRSMVMVDGGGIGCISLFRFRGPA